MRQPIHSTDNGTLDRSHGRKSFGNGKCEQIAQSMLSAVENHFGPGRPYATAPHHYGSNAGTNLLAAPIGQIVALPSATTVVMSPNEFARPHPKTSSNRYVLLALLIKLYIDIFRPIEIINFILFCFCFFLFAYSYNGNQSLRGCNGISASSSRVKYSQVDQSSPVNLAVSSQLSLSMPSTIGSGMPPQNHKQSPLSSSLMLGGDTSAASIKSQQHSHSEQDAIHNSIASLYAPTKLPYSTAEAVAAYQQFNYPSLYGRPASIYG